MRITMLGTGHAVVTECYNTCWTLHKDDGSCLLVDGGGGSGIVTQMARAGIAWSSVHEVFVTHRHVDHLLGVVWALRMVGMEIRRGTYGGTLTIFGNTQTLEALERVVHELLWDVGDKLLGKRIVLKVVSDGDTGQLVGLPVTFFDVHAPDVSQLGFVMEYAPGRTLACCGDVQLKEENVRFVRGATWLLHESFCLSDHPASSFIHRVGHSTVAEAAAIAEQVGAQNLLLYHTEDGDLAGRRERYTAEAQEHFSGAVYVPDDLEQIEL